MGAGVDVGKTVGISAGIDVRIGGTAVALDFTAPPFEAHADRRVRDNRKTK